MLFYVNILFLFPLDFPLFAFGYVLLLLILYFWFPPDKLGSVFNNKNNNLFFTIIVSNNISKYVFLNITNISNIYRILPPQWK